MIDRSTIAAAHRKIAGLVRTTPVLRLSGADAAAFGAPGGLCLKLELMQHAGSFKPRGAFARILANRPPAGGMVVAASGGNHGAAVAYAASVLGLSAEIFVPELASPAKQARIRGFGARLHVEGATYAEALAASEAFAARHGALQVHAYDMAETIAGQGTFAREFEAAAPELATVLVAVGGIAADSLGARQLGALAFPIAQKFVADSLLVADSAIRAAQVQLWDRLRIAAEPGGATALAALLSGAYRPRPDECIGVPVCGGNFDPAALA